MNRPGAGVALEIGALIYGPGNAAKGCEEGAAWRPSMEEASCDDARSKERPDTGAKGVAGMLLGVDVPNDKRLDTERGLRENADEKALS